MSEKGDTFICLCANPMIYTNPPKTAFWLAGFPFSAFLSSYFIYNNSILKT